MRLRQGKSESLRRKILDAMTNNETWFFRDFYPFEALRQEILPALMKVPRRYSHCAFLERRGFERAGTLQHRDVAEGELCAAGLEIFDPGDRYLQRRAGARRRGQVFADGGQSRTSGIDVDEILCKRRAGLATAPSIREMVEFRACNLAEPWFNIPKMDVVFLRNVMIYFEVEIRKRILARLRSVLQPDSVLFLGCAETTLNIDAGFERVPFQKTVYYRLRS